MILFYAWIPYFLMIMGVRSWSPSSWREKVPYQLPQYPDPLALQHTEEILRTKSPLIFSGECQRLKHQLGMASQRQGFVLVGGDCAETFDEFSANKVRDDFRLLLQMSLVLGYGCGLPITQIARLAGQFGKPRSEDTETLFNTTLPSYRGDIINGVAFHALSRTPDPQRMLSAYHQSVQTLNLIRAFIQGGFSNIDRLQDWELISTKTDAAYLDTLHQVKRCLQFMHSMDIKASSRIDRFFTGHECLLLPYEEALTRTDSLTGQYLDCSAHFLWLGERTRYLDGAQLEFLRGVMNPIGIKISASTSIGELLEILDILNPDLEPGKITLFSRMGKAKIATALPPIIHAVEASRHRNNVLWCCDPMHGNTFTKDGIKTRSMKDIREELLMFFDIHKELGTFPGGIHLEMTSNNVTEWIDHPLIPITDSFLRGYKSTCDPRLSGSQALEMAFIISQRLLSP